MEKKRYQVFVSSTFEDLKDERAKIFSHIMSTAYIPVGMEQFPAFDEEQLEYIKKVIDDSDYYVLVIKARYGSVNPEGISFTEEEYDYAVQRGIPVLAFIHGDPQEVARGTDRDPTKEAFLEAFRKKVANGRLVKYWKTPDELVPAVLLALAHSTSRRPGIGWIRGDVAAGVEILTELNEVRKHNEELQKELNEYKSKNPDSIADIAALSEDFEIPFTLDDGRFVRKPKYTWAEIFRAIGPPLMTPQLFRIIKIQIENLISENAGLANGETFSVSESVLSTIKFQFIAYNFIESLSGHTFKHDVAYGEYLQLTPTGRRALIEDMVVRTKFKSLSTGDN